MISMVFVGSPWNFPNFRRCCQLGKEIDFKKGMADALRKLAVAHLAKGRWGGASPGLLT